MVKVMNFNKKLLGFFLFLGVFVFAQEDVKDRTFEKIPESEVEVDRFGNKFYYDKVNKARYYRINGETIVIMDELTIIQKPKFNNQLDENYYRFINRKLSRVYPLFLVALEQYDELNKQLEKIENKADKRKFSKKKYEELSAQYEKILRNLTTSEGRIFAKLMNRATGKTVFEITKDFRGGWSAFWWNVKGKLADVDIKTPYDPHKDRSDYYLENLLQTNWNANNLPPYPGYKDFKVKK